MIVSGKDEVYLGDSKSGVVFRDTPQKLPSHFIRKG